MSRRTRGVQRFTTAASRAESLETRQLFAAFGAGASPAASLTDADGTLVTVTLAGPGSGTIDADDGGRLRLSVRDTTAASSVTLTTDAGGNGLGDLGGVDLAGAALRAFTARTADLHGDLTAAAAVRTIWLNAAPGDADGGTISAPSIGELRTNGDLAADVRVAGRAGAINVGGSASGLLVRASRIDKFDVRGDLTGAKVLLFPGPDYHGPAGLRRLTVGGAMRGSRVNALADIGAVSAGAMFDSHVVAGVRFEEVHPANGVFEPVLPTEHYDGAAERDKEFDFTGRYALGSVGVTAAVTDAGGFAFTNSRVAAHRIGSVKLVGVQPDNGGRASGVAGYRVGRVQRQFGGPDGPALTREEHPRTNYFHVRQLFQPLRFDPGTGSYSGGTTTGAGSLTVISPGIGSTAPLPTIIPAEGVQVGTTAGHAAAATVWLNPDRSYDARNAEGAVVARDATLAGMALQLVGAPGTSMKIIPPRELPAGSFPPPFMEMLPLGWAVGPTLLSTSVSPELEITTSHHARFQDAAGTVFHLPDQSALVAQIEALGATTEVLTKPLRKVRDEPLLVGRRFDDEHGVRTVSLSPTLTLQVIGENGADLSGTADDLVGALLGDAVRLGAGRLSPTVHDGRTGLTLSGLGDGGTAVLYVKDQIALNAVGDTLALPGRNEASGRLSALGMPPGRHEPEQPTRFTRGGRGSHRPIP